MINIEYITSKLHLDSFVILLFHGVVKEINTEIRNYTRKHILAKEFESLLEQLKKKGESLSMDEVIWHYENGKNLPPYSYAVTFDDGFENNFSLAAPILDKHSTPATFYVSTNLVDKNQMTWIDQIEYCFENMDKASIQLPWEKSSIKLICKESKIACLEDIRTQVKTTQLYKPEKIVAMIFDQCGLDPVSSNDHHLDQKMNWDEVSKLHLHELFTVGGHSHNHISLGSLDSSDMENEIVTSVNYLKNNADISSPHYSYPEGMENDFNKNVIEVLKKNDIKCCPTAIDGLNDLRTSSLFHLKRVMVS